MMAVAGAYYNEFDPKAAAWLRELIADGLIAPGEVDERDIRDVTPDDLRSFRQVHLFAGIGGWSAALRKAGWPDDHEVWTASCPCQPFSAAGGRGGFADERHLWPAVHHLAGQCRPPVLLGEQVASKDGLAWIDLVSSDMEAAGYAGGALDLCSAGFGAPNIRQRLYFVWMADTDGRNAGTEGLQRSREHGQRAQDGGAGGVGDTGCSARERNAGAISGTKAREHGARLAVDGRLPVGLGDAGSGVGAEQPGPVNGFWRASDWIGCTDGKWRAVAPGSFPLASGIPGRVALLRGAGNAINVEVAAGFVEAVMALSEPERLAA